MKKLLLVPIIVIPVVIAIFFFRSRGQYEEVSSKRGSVTEAIYGIGTVTARKTYQVKVGVTAALRGLFVAEGSEVKKGDSLLQMEDSGVLRAPFDGTITALIYQQGEIAFPQAPIMTLTDLHDRYIVVSLEQQGALRVKKGQLARLSFESLRGEKYEGRITRVFPNEGQFLVHIEVKELNPQIMPGMTADVSIEVGQNKDALLIPVAALSGGKISVRRKGSIEKIEVKVGSIDNEWAEVLTGDVKPDDVILIKKQ